MKNARILFIVFTLLVPGLILAQDDVRVYSGNDPLTKPPVVVMNNVAVSTTSVAYIIQYGLDPNLVINFQAYGTGTGTFEVQGTLDSDAQILASTATWTTFYSTTTLPKLGFIQGPPRKIRFVWTRTGGNLTLKVEFPTRVQYRIVAP